MSQIIQEKDFIELNYTGKLPDGKVFDTTVEEVAKKSGLNNSNPNIKYEPFQLCVGEKQILPGIDDQLVGKEIGQKYEIKLTAENAFGKRDVKKVQLIPLSSFTEHNLKPYPGLQVDFDGKVGTVMRISGGRVMVNFNHPLAGKDVIYEVEIIRKITNTAEQIKAYLGNIMRNVKNLGKIKIDEDKANIAMPFELPEQFTKELSKKLEELTNLKEVKFTKEEVKTQEKK